jgi:NAD(P)-dependent dehydrogenase (short-subunit alcohol dehydrogenase family)
VPLRASGQRPLAYSRCRARQSPSANLRCPVLFDDPTFTFVVYDPFAAYGQSKTANVLLAVEADRRWARDGIRANALMPGGIATNLQRHVNPEALAQARRQAGAPTELKTLAQGAATSVLAAASPLVHGIGGRYLEDCHEAQTLASRAEGDGRHGVAPYALDADNAQRLWDTSERRLASLRS